MEQLYSRCLYATDLGPQSLYIGQRAVQLSKICQAELTILHVIEPPITYTADFAKRDEQAKKIQESAKKSLAALSAQLGIAENAQQLLIGIPQDEILQMSIQKKYNLIIVGSHGIGGYNHALGSTAQHLVMQAHCDVHIVQVGHLKDKIQANPRPEYYWWETHHGEAPKTPHVSSGPKYSGSQAGFGGEIRRGPRPSKRPPGSPYHGGTRKDDEENDDNKDK